MTLASVSSTPLDERRLEFLLLQLVWLSPLRSSSWCSTVDSTMADVENVGLSRWSAFKPPIRFDWPSLAVNGSPGIEKVWTIFERCRLVLRGGRRSSTIRALEDWPGTGTVVVRASCISLACSSMVFRPALNRFSQSGVSGFDDGGGSSFNRSPPIVMTTLLASKRRLAEMDVIEAPSCWLAVGAAGGPALLSVVVTVKEEELVMVDTARQPDTGKTDTETKKQGVKIAILSKLSIFFLQWWACF